MRRLNVTFGLASAVVLPGTDAAVAGNRFGELFLVQGTTVDRFMTEPYGCEVPATRIPAVGVVRGMVTTTEGNLLVVTASGMVQRLPFGDGYLNNASVARVANERLERALSLGLGEQRPT